VVLPAFLEHRGWLCPRTAPSSEALSVEVWRERILVPNPGDVVRLLGAMRQGVSLAADNEGFCAVRGSRASRVSLSAVLKSL